MRVLIFILMFISCTGENVVKNNIYDIKYPDYYYTESTHFIINYDKSINRDEIENILNISERSYFSVMQDTNLFSFVPSNPYRIIVHKDREDYLKVSSNTWSAGFINGDKIEVYISSQTPCVLAHEITHLILNEFMGEIIELYPWISEGLATYQERKVCSDVDIKYEYFKSKFKGLFYPQQIFLNYKPYINSNSDDVMKFYVQSSDIIKFMIEREGSFKFYLFLNAIKNSVDLDNALKQTYPVSFNSFDKLLNDWLNSF